MTHALVGQSARAVVLMCLALQIGPSPRQRMAAPDRALRGAPTAERDRVVTALAALPLSFEPNVGQFASDVAFLTRASEYVLQLNATEFRMIVRGAPAPLPTAAQGAAGRATPAQALRFSWRDANRQAAATAEAQLPGTANYLRGRDASQWRTGVPTYARVRFEALYPGIDVTYYGNGRQLEYDLIVAPNADPGLARLVIEGAGAELTSDGDLDVELADGRTMQVRAPVAYQEHDGQRVAVEASYRVTTAEDATEVSFRVGAYDAALPLVIDPLVYSTFLGGSSFDKVAGIAINAANEAFVTGDTTSTDFPTTGGSFDPTSLGGDAYVARLNSAGTALIYSTFLGGTTDTDYGKDIAVNAADEAFVTGETYSTDFPTTAGAFDTTHNGGGRCYGDLACLDVFVARLNAAGSALVYSTFLGGSGDDHGAGIAVTASNEAFVTGWATVESGPAFPTTPGAFDTTHNNGFQDAFVTRLNSAGTSLVYSTLLGGNLSTSASDIAVNASDEAFVTGGTYSADFPTTAGAFDTSANGSADSFVARMNSAGSALIYSTFLGGGLDDAGTGIAINAADEAFVTGTTVDPAFPTTAGAFDTTFNGGRDGFVSRLNGAGTALVYSTFVGGSGDDYASAIAVNASDEAFVTGYTPEGVVDFPTTAGAFDTDHNGGGEDVFVARLSGSGAALVYSTLLGSSSGAGASAIAVNASNDVFVAGTTYGGFPTTVGVFDPTRNGGPDGFVTRLTTSANAVADHYATPFDAPLLIAAPGVLANDQNPGGSAMTAGIVSTTLHGVLSLAADGGFSYTPAAGFAGVDAFTYRVSSAAGPGTTATVSLVVAAVGTPLPPERLFVTSITGHAVTFGWLPPTSGPTITGFQIEGGVSPGDRLGFLPLGLARSVTLTLPTGSFYLRVRAISGGTSSIASNEVLVHVGVPVPPSEPHDLLGLVTGDTLHLAWTNTLAGGAPTGVVLDVLGTWSGSVPLGLTDRFSFSGVPPGTYKFRVRATNASGSSTQSNPVTLAFACSGSPQPVTNFVAYSLGGTIFVSWDPGRSGPAPTAYAVIVTGAFVGHIPTPLRQLSGAAPDGTYHISVAATNPCGTSAPTPPQTVIIR